MKKIKKGILSLIASGTIMAIPLVSCSYIIHYDPQDSNLDIELMSSRLAFSNWTLSSSQGAQYSLSASGDIQNGDIIRVSIGEQTSEGLDVNYIKLSDNSIIHNVGKSGTNFDVILTSVSQQNHDVFTVNFSLIFQVMRNQITISKKEVKNFVFVNGTPTPSNFFDKTQSTDSLKVNGFVLDDFVQEQLKLCNIFVLPQGTTDVESQAFRAEIFPASIQRVYLDYSELDSSFAPTLQRILPQAFMNCPINNKIVLPSTLELIGSKAFFECTGVSSIELHRKDIAIGQLAFGNIPGITELDVSIYDNVQSLPQNWSSQCFLKSLDEGNEMICYRNTRVREQDWINFLESLDIDVSNWHFDWRNDI